jgi:hypothetical protein
MHDFLRKKQQNSIFWEDLIKKLFWVGFGWSLGGVWVEFGWSLGGVWVGVNKFNY